MTFPSRFDINFWKELLYKAWLYDWGLEDIIAYCEERGKVRQFRLIYGILERAKQDLEEGRLGKRLSQKELDFLGRNSFLWAFSKIFF